MESLHLQIVEEDGVRYVEEGPSRNRSRSPAPPRRRASSRGTRADLLVDVALPKLEPSNVSAALRAADVRCNDYLALDKRRFGALREISLNPKTARARFLNLRGPVADGSKILLFVHGTFSETPSFFDGFANLSKAERQTLYAWMSTHYDRILGFDHPTLGLNPALNARRLHEELGALPNAHIDVICHSRGGLVTRWWMEGFDAGPATRRRALFVGAPLNGTGLAAPANIRATLSLLLSYTDALVTRPLRWAGAVFPAAGIVSTLFQVVTSVTSLAVKSPAIDAAIALVPGLNAMSRTSNNLELQAGRRIAEVRERYYFVQSNFETEDVGWKFWRHFRRDQLINTAADTVFAGKNDLVVDLTSMTDLTDARAATTIPKSQVLDFGTNADVHHTNYFSHPSTAAWIRDVF
ncbi:MAG: hypothetical protein AAF648_07610 [Pseudomonadota bacterium]